MDTKVKLLGDKCLNAEYGVEYYRVALVDDGREGWMNGAFLVLTSGPLALHTTAVPTKSLPTAPSKVTADMARLEELKALMVVTTECSEACADSLVIWLDGATPLDYELALVSSGGDKARVRCVDGKAKERWGYLMPDPPWWSIGCIDWGDRQGANWHGRPSIVTVTVTWDGSHSVQRIEPEYEEFCLCAGCCYVGGITITLPISP